MHKPRWMDRMRESSAASSAATLERAGSKDEGALGKIEEDGGDTVECPTCKGSGKIRGGGMTCPTCDGSGKVSASKTSEAESALSDAESGEDVADAACTTCGGSGVTDGVVCDDCNGVGTGGTSGADADEAVPEARGSGGNGDNNVPEVRGSGGNGEQTAPEVAGGGPGAKQRIPEVSGGGLGEGSGKVTAEARALIREVLADPASWVGDGSLRESAAIRVMREKDYSTADRVQMAKDGDAIPIRNDKGEVTGGAYPVKNGGDVDNAISAYGRNPVPQTKAHIVKVAKKHGTPDQVKRAQDLGKTAEAEELRARMDRLEQTLGAEGRLREAKPAVLNATYSNPTTSTSSGGQKGYQVVLIREGRGNVDDDNWYTGAAIREMCESGVCEGMQAYANHPSLDEEEIRPERDVKQLVGYYQDIKFSESEGKPAAEAVFVPMTTDETHPTYGWVICLAEAAVRSQAPQPLAGISLYGLSAGDYGERPDGSEGRIVTMIRPTSGDIVTNAGAGGGFIKQMWESARRLRRQHNNSRKEQPMRVAEVQKKIQEATSRLREADPGSDEYKAAMTDLEALQTVEVDATAPVDSLEALQESQPKLVEQIREAAKREVATEDADVRQQLVEARAALSTVGDVVALSGILREAGVTDEVEQRYFAGQAKSRGLTDAGDITDMIENERAFRKQQAEGILEQVREAAGDDLDIEGIFARTPAMPEDGGVAVLAAAGVPVKDAA